MTTIKTCDFCYKESVLGCTGVGPETEFGCLDVMGICPTCKLTSLRSSIPYLRTSIEECEKELYYTDMEEDKYDYVEKSYFLSKNKLEEYYQDQLYLAGEVNNYFAGKYPSQVHPLNKSIEENLQLGIYTNCSNGNLTVKLNLTTRQDRLVAEEYTRALGIPSEHMNEYEKLILF